jgi:hypothetical protein
LVQPSVLNLLFLDIASDFLRVPAYRIHEEAPRPEVLPHVIALPLQYVPRYVDRTLSLQIAHHAGNSQLRWNTDQHMHVIGQDMSFLDHTLFLLGQPVEHRPKLFAHHPEERPAAILRDKYDMVFALPFCMTQTSVFFHGSCVVVRFGRLTTAHHGRLHDKSNSESLPGRAGGTPIGN